MVPASRSALRCFSRSTAVGLLLVVAMLLISPLSVVADVHEGVIASPHPTTSLIDPTLSSALIVVDTPPSAVPISVGADVSPKASSPPHGVFGGFAEAFASTWAMIIVSELGDKTFFIAAIMAMSHPRLDVFLSASAALFVMTVLSVGLGVALPTFLPRSYTHWASCALFIVFGVKLLYAALMGEDDEESDEMKEVEEELAAASACAAADAVSADDISAKSLPPSGSRMAAGLSGLPSAVATVEDDDEEASLVGAEQQALTAGIKGSDAATGEARRKGLQPGVLTTIRLWSRRLVTPVMAQCFTMTFLAEWGDRSQISTIALAASKNAVGVTVGGVVGHAICTGLAVVGGKLLASRISERAVNAIGGVLFVIFAAWGVAMGPE